MTLRSQSSWRTIHGAVFAVLMACTYAFPAFRGWPWVWFAPFLGYFLLVVCIPKLRHSLGWLRIGKLSVAPVGAAIAIMALTALVLVAFDAFAKPDVRGYRAALPLDALGGVIMAGVIFVIVNGTLEGLVFRGIFFDALESQW